jgi:acetate kinase
MKILVINSGSSSLKYQLFDMESGKVLAKGGCERIGAGGSGLTSGRHGQLPVEVDLPSHDRALEIVFGLLTDKEHGVISSIDEIDAVGHRVAHGGEKYKKSSRVDIELINYLETIVPINPLHGPPAIKGMRACLRLLPKTPQAAVFDTSFYADIEDSDTFTHCRTNTTPKTACAATASTERRTDTSRARRRRRSARTSKASK